MAQRLIRLPWQQQPQEVVLCPSEQYADMTCGWVGSQPDLLIGSLGGQWTRNGSPIIGPSRAGLASRAASYGTAAYYTGPSISGTSLAWPGITVVAVLPAFVDIGANFPAALCIAPSEDYYGIANLSFQVSGYNSVFWRAGNSANYLTATAYNNTALANEWAAGDDLVIVARWDKTTSKLAVSRNGVITRNSAGHAYGWRTGAHLLSVGGHTRSGNRMLVSPLAMAAVLPRDVGDQAENELLNNPWQLFEGQRIWVPVSAGGGGAILAGAAGTTTSASGALSTAAALAGTAATPATAAATLACRAPLVGAASTSATAQGALIALAALAGASATRAVATGALSVGSAGAWAAASATATTSQGAITVRAPLVGSSSTSAIGAGAITVGAGGGYVPALETFVSPTRAKAFASPSRARMLVSPSRAAAFQSQSRALQPFASPSRAEVFASPSRAHIFISPSRAQTFVSPARIF